MVHGVRIDGIPYGSSNSDNSWTTLQSENSDPVFVMSLAALLHANLSCSEGFLVERPMGRGRTETLGQNEAAAEETLVPH